jgi:M6 family metalloprotease-like protein
MSLPATQYGIQIVPVSGIIRVLVIAVVFPDVNYTVSVAQLRKTWFMTVPAYYRELSYGKLTIQGDVYGWYKLPYPESHYGRHCHGINDPDCSGLNQSWQIAEDAVSLAEKDVNISHYDYFVFIHSGRGQETSHIKDDIWSVTYVNASIRTTSKTITQFNIVPELEEPPYVPNGDWILEFAHNLGVPDLWNTTAGPSNARTILGPWELMDKGSWNGDPPGSLPAHMTAWPKIQLGFISGSTLAIANRGATSAFTVDPTEVASRNLHAIKIPLANASNTSQYYLVEVRTRTGFDSALPKSGVLITYIDETLSVGSVRIVNRDPSTPDLSNAAWDVGQTFTDSQHRIVIKVTGKSGSLYQITVNNNGPQSSPSPVRPLYANPQRVALYDLGTDSTQAENAISDPTRQTTRHVECDGPPQNQH